MIVSAFSSLLFAQLVAPATLREDRLEACLDEARNSPALAIATASEWLQGAEEVERSYPQQCLGFAYMSLLRWEAAQAAFVSARDLRSAGDFLGRARLGGMAGNAAIAAADFEPALDILVAAQSDAIAAGRSELAGQIASDRSRALVGLGREADATTALATARELATQDAQVWLHSAPLARRMADLDNAQAWIETAAALEPDNPAIGLEAGLIAATGGFDDTARTSWQSVIDIAPQSPEAERARAFLDQLNGTPPVEGR